MKQLFTSIPKTCLVCDKEATNLVWTPEVKGYCTEHFYQVYPQAQKSLLEQQDDFIFNQVKKYGISS